MPLSSEEQALPLFVPSTPCTGTMGPADRQQDRTLSGLPEGRGGHN